MKLAEVRKLSEVLRHTRRAPATARAKANSDFVETVFQSTTHAYFGYSLMPILWLEHWHISHPFLNPCDHTEA